MNFIKILNVIIVALIFLFCGSVYPIIFGANLFYLLIFVTSLASLLLQNKYKRDYLVSFTKSIGALSIALLLNWVLTGFNLMFVEYPVMFAIIIIFNLALLALINYSEFSIYTFDRVFIFILFYSTANFIAANFFKSFFVPFAIDSYACSHFNYVFFYVGITDLLGSEIVRNQAFYWEPGVLSVILNIFLFRLIYGKDIAFKKFLLILTSVLILTTASTTGLALVVFQFAYYFLTKKKSKLISVISLIVLFILSAPLLVSNLTEKLTGKEEVSFLLRNYDIIVALDVTKSNPINGVGFSSVQNKSAQERSEIYLKSEITEARGNTNSIVTVFLYLGIPLGICLFFVLYQQGIVNFRRGLFFFVLIICLSSEPLIFSGFMITFISSFFYKRAQAQYALENNNIASWKSLI